MLHSLLVVLPLAGLLLLPLAIGSLFYRLGANPTPPAQPRVGLRAAPTAFLKGVVLTLLILSPFAFWTGWCRAKPRGELEAADSFVVFSFGLGPTVNGQPTAGASNRALAEWLVKNNRGKKLTVVQEGVYLALQEL